MLNQTSFRLTTTLLPTDTTAKTTEVINKVDSSGNKFKPTFTEETVVLTNDDRTIMETTRATATDWVLTFVKRGLSDDNSATEVANRKLTWNPWTLAFITAWASDWIDIDDNLTWTGKQTYTGELVSENKATYKWQLVTEKWVKYPNFTDVTALQAYADPFGWMFATVDDTWELYRYNARTCCWDLVSTVDIGTYTIQASEEAPAPWTADTIITLNPTTWNIYLWDKVLVWRTKNLQAQVDLTAVGWWGAGWGGWYCCDGYHFAGSWWWGGEVLSGKYVLEKKSYDVVIWCWGKHVSGGHDTSKYPWYTSSWLDWGDTKFGAITAHWWQGAKNYSNSLCSIWWTSWGGYSWATPQRRCWGGWWWGAGAAWAACWCPFRHWGNGWAWKCWFGWWWWGGTYYFNSQDCWWAWGTWGGWAWWNCDQNWCNATCYWWWWGWWASRYEGTYNWGDGCQWIVIVKYASDWSDWISCATWGTVTTETIDDVEYCVHTFTANWTFCIVS